MNKHVVAGVFLFSFLAWGCHARSTPSPSDTWDIEDGEPEREPRGMDEESSHHDERPSVRKKLYSKEECHDFPVEWILETTHPWSLGERLTIRFESYLGGNVWEDAFVVLVEEYSEYNILLSTSFGYASVLEEGDVQLWVARTDQDAFLNFPPDVLHRLGVVGYAEREDDVPIYVSPGTREPAVEICGEGGCIHSTSTRLKLHEPKRDFGCFWFTSDHFEAGPLP